MKLTAILKPVFTKSIAKCRQLFRTTTTYVND